MQEESKIGDNLHQIGTPSFNQAPQHNQMFSQSQGDQKQHSQFQNMMEESKEGDDEEEGGEFGLIDCNIY